MTLLEYIKQSYLRPNKAILQSLGASDELIEYLLKTPSNTNINMVIDGFGINGGSGGDSSEGIVLLDWADCTTGDDGDKTEDWYAALYFDSTNFNYHNLVKEGDTLQIEITNGTDSVTVTSVIAELYEGSTTTYFTITDFDNEYGMTVFLNSAELEVSCCKNYPFPNAQDAWTLPASTYDYANTKIRITKLSQSSGGDDAAVVGTAIVGTSKVG